eukprot:m.91138 g.91138  ORF g.91138 m.91138 type:complete len:56 (-) comp15028_c0_seq7:209-376(-)
MRPLGWLGGFQSTITSDMVTRDTLNTGGVVGGSAFVRCVAMADFGPSALTPYDCT